MTTKLPPYYDLLYNEIKNIPFYKVDDGYQYAAYLLENEDTSSVASSILYNKTEDTSVYDMSEADETKMVDIFKAAIQTLSELKLSDDDFMAWTTFEKEQGGIKEYHQIFEKLREDLVAHFFENHVLMEVSKYEISQAGADTNCVIINDYMNDNPMCSDYQKMWDDYRKASDNFNSSTNTVLNHNNPFADISIEEQHFIYGSVMEQFERLELRTSHTVTKVAKDTEKSYMTLQPGFKIRKSKNTVEDTKQDVIFDDTMTTEITQVDDNVYVYID